jgi:NodT family efflux transporter outer membrane factor (OMF) lipoprotein
MMRAKRWVLLSLLCLSGCVSLPKDEQRENLIAPPSVSVKEGLESGFFAMGDWPTQNWWEIFHSEELNGLIAEALQQNPTVQSFQRRIEEAKQEARVVRGKLFPLLSFDADETWEYLSKNGLYRAFNPKIPLNANLVDLTLSFTYEFDFWGKNRNLFRAALGEEKAKEAESADVDLMTTTSLAQSYFALKTNQMRKGLYEELYQVRAQIFDLQNLLREKALLSSLEPLLSEETVLESQKLIFSIEEEIEIDEHLINILMGRGPDHPLNLQEDAPLPLNQIPLPNDLSLDLLARRPDLMAQIWRVESLAHEVGAAKADFYPDISLKAFLGLESVFYRTLLRNASKTAGLQPAIHLPIFTAGAIRANIRAKKAAFDTAVFAYNQLLLKSVSEVADGLSLIRSVMEQREDQEQIIAAAAARCDLISLRELSGLDSLFEGYRVKEELILKQLDDLTLLYTQYAATVKLIKALGGGYISEYTVPLRGDK